MWWFVASLAAMQVYFVRELLAVFALFTAVFAAAVTLIAVLYMARTGWELALARLAHAQRSVVPVTLDEKAGERAS